MSVDPNLFDIHENEGLRLITPARGTMGLGNAPWTEATSKYRSRVETLEGETVSQGFKKFFNLGSGPLETQVSVEDVVKAAEKKDVIATLKLDGSLLIRSVYAGKVMLRTRGSFGYEFLDNADEMELFKTLYPAVFDPKLFPNYSILFEWTSPRNVIVLKYEEPDITLIGAIEHSPNLPYLRIDQLKHMASYLDVDTIRSFPLTKDGWAELQTQLETNNELEGYVLRLDGEQTLVKVKCAPYLTKHGLKSTLSTEKLVDMWFQQGEPSYKAFCDKFLGDFDEETLIWAMGAISNLFDGIKEFKAIYVHMLDKASSRWELSRKDAALAGLSDYGKTKRFSLYMNLWERSQPKVDLLKTVLLQSTKQVEFSMFKSTNVMGD